MIGGAVLKHSRDFNLMRECVLGSALSRYTPAFDLQQACGTGLQATIAAADGIAARAVSRRPPPAESTPHPTPRSRSATICAGSCSGFADPSPTSTGSSWSASCLPPLGVEIPTNSEPRTGMSMGEHAAITAKQMGVKRVDQDELAAASHRTWRPPTTAASSTIWSAPFLGLYRDNNLRADSSAEKLAKLKPVFGVKSGDATMTAGNSTPLTDGASVSLLATDEWADGARPSRCWRTSSTARPRRWTTSTAATAC